MTSRAHVAMRPHASPVSKLAQKPARHTTARLLFVKLVRTNPAHALSSPVSVARSAGTSTSRSSRPSSAAFVSAAYPSRSSDLPPAPSVRFVRPAPPASRASSSSSNRGVPRRTPRRSDIAIPLIKPLVPASPPPPPPPTRSRSATNRLSLRTNAQAANPTSKSAICA